jgi:hypothetical protein
VEHTDIAPLAKRLAEENNVDWRRLRGSGDRGRIVERDVLEYLARVMAGEEDVDPTPEPVPAGMMAWPESDVRAFELERRGEAVPDPHGPATIDEDIFLLDGDGDDLSDSFAAEPRPSPPPRSVDAPNPYAFVDADDLDADLLVAGDDDIPAGVQEPSAFDEGDLDFSSGDVAHAANNGSLPDLFDESPASPAWRDVPVFDDEPPRRSSPSLTGVPSLDAVEPPSRVPTATPPEVRQGARDTGSFRAASIAGIVAAPEHAAAPGLTAVVASGALPLVQHGAVLRRHVDLSDLVAAQADVARDLGQSEPIPLLAFLARAAAKASGAGRVAVALFDDEGVRMQTVAAHSFLETVSSLADAAWTEAGTEAETSALVVADLSDLEVDEAVVHLGVPVLALGRVLVDSATGGRRATLSLSGDAVGADAARLLAKVAELLETPVRVVM